jgi:hypothetical protein
VSKDIASAATSSSNAASSNNTLRDTQVRCLIAYNTLMNKSLRNLIFMMMKFSEKKDILLLFIVLRME